MTTKNFFISFEFFHHPLLANDSLLTVLYRPWECSRKLSGEILLFDNGYPNYIILKNLIVNIDWVYLCFLIHQWLTHESSPPHNFRICVGLKSVSSPCWPLIATPWWAKNLIIRQFFQKAVDYYVFLFHVFDRLSATLLIVDGTMTTWALNLWGICWLGGPKLSHSFLPIGINLEDKGYQNYVPIVISFPRLLV